MKTLVSIIVVNYNGLEVSLEMISSVYQHVRTPFEIIVIDNGSTSNEAEKIQLYEPRVIAIRSEKNLGFAGANNLGMQHARGEYFLLMNNDTTIAQDIIPPLLNRFVQSEHIGAVGPKVRFETPPQNIQFAGFTPMSPVTIRNQLIGYNEPERGQYDTPRKTSALLGAAMMVSRKAAERAGFMHDAYFLYYEELDWCERIKEAGFELWYEPGATVFHKGSIAVGGIESPLRIYYQTRNRLYFAQRNVKIPMRWLSYGFQLGIVFPRDCLKKIMNGNANLIKFHLMGVRDFFTKTDSFQKLKSNNHGNTKNA